MPESELELHNVIKSAAEQIAELAHSGKTDFTSADIIDMDVVQQLVTNAIVQRLAQREDIETAENIDIGVDYQPDIKVEANELTKMSEEEIKGSSDTQSEDVCMRM